jgi:hypothetical protein
VDEAFIATDVPVKPVAVVEAKEKAPARKAKKDIS